MEMPLKPNVLEDMARDVSVTSDMGWVPPLTLLVSTG